MIAVLGIGGHRVLSGDMSTGQMLEFMQYIVLLVAPLRSLGMTVAFGQRAAAALLRVDEVLRTVAALLAGFVVVAALAAALAEVLEDVLVGDGINAVDGPTTTWLAAHRDPWLTAALKGVSLLGNTAAEVTVAVLVSVAVRWRSGKWLPAVLGLIGTAGIGLLILTAKLVVGRSRPALPYAIVSEDGYSFPSGHATGTAAVGLLCAWMLSRWLVTSWAGRVAVWSVAVGVTGAVGFSRVYLGVHYVSDVVAGWLLGAAWAGAVMLVGVWWDNTRAVTASGTSAGSPDVAPAPDWRPAAGE
ncbi:MAG TPA: phosphatase PAP2 family protein [Mycobacterium sp.]|nr:phosphatase PAP2 family protein [Mycobacterium sp.]